MVMGQNIEINIDELVLHGFSPGDRYRIGEAVELELTRLISEQGIPSSLSRGGEQTRMNGGTFNMSPNSRAELVGTQVAQSVYKGFIK